MDVVAATLETTKKANKKTIVTRLPNARKTCMCKFIHTTK